MTVSSAPSRYSPIRNATPLTNNWLYSKTMRQERPADLNESQWQAVTHQSGHLLIVAGPGTGKTHTLIHRIARTIPVLKSHESILAITFTNKAAMQMRDR